MKNLISNIMAAGLWCTLIMAAPTFTNASASEVQKTSFKKSIVGVWLWQLQGRDCTSGAPLGGSAPGVLTFATGGTLSETTTVPTPIGVPFFRSPGHGFWDKQNAVNYTAAFILQRLSADGSFAGRTILRGTIQLSENDDEFTWTGSGEVLAPNGTVLLNTCNTATAVRFE